MVGVGKEGNGGGRTKDIAPLLSLADCNGDTGEIMDKGIRRQQKPGEKGASGERAVIVNYILLFRWGPHVSNGSVFPGSWYHSSFSEVNGLFFAIKVLKYGKY